jgi:uncharacterized phage-associated protein
MNYNDYINNSSEFDDIFEGGDFQYLSENKTYKDDLNVEATEEEENSNNWSPKEEYSPNEEKLPVNVFDVAAYIVKKLGQISTMKLQKLVYYSQAWSLVWDEEPLFNEKIEAWANGPVIRELFSFHRGHYYIDNVPIGNPENLGENQKETIDAVLDFYGNKSAKWLIDLTHMEKPWKKSRKGLTPTERGNREIKLDLIADYYSSL